MMPPVTDQTPSKRVEWLDRNRGAIDHETGRWTLNELQDRRRQERDRRLLGMGILTAAAVVLGLLALMLMGGPRVEDPLPYPTTTSVQPWQTCDVYGLHISCRTANGTDHLELNVANQTSLDNLCQALPCVVHPTSAGKAGNAGTVPR